MAHLTYAVIEGLAGRKQPVEITFDRFQNVIFGVNGVGKTTLLKILHSAMSLEHGLVHGLPFDRAEVGVYSAARKMEFVREYVNPAKRVKSNPQALGEILFGDSASSLGGKASDMRWRTRQKRAGEMKATDPSSETKFAHEYLPTTRLISVTDMAALRRSGSADPSEETSINNMMEAQLQQQWIRYFAPLQAKVQEEQQKGIAQILRTVLAPDEDVGGESALDPDKAYELVSQFLAAHSSVRMPATKKVFLERYKSDSGLAAVVNSIRSLGERVESIQRPRDQLQKLLSGMFLNKRVDLSGGNIRVLFSVGSEDQDPVSLRLSQLSSGEKQALYVLIHALRADINTLLIDEPELSMHIDWQRQLVGAIRSLNSNAQVVMATHSPEVMATIEERYIFEI